MNQQTENKRLWKSKRTDYGRLMASMSTSTYATLVKDKNFGKCALHKQNEENTSDLNISFRLQIY